jgi:hypothetical protein
MARTQAIVDLQRPSRFATAAYFRAELTLAIDVGH